MEAVVARSETALHRFVANADKKCNPGPLSVALASGMGKLSGADIAVASLGISAGSEELAPEERESGKTCIAVSGDGGDAYWEFRFSGMDGINQTRATVLTIEMLRRYLTGYVDPDHPHQMRAKS